MDFSSQLANLQRSASRAASSNNNSNENNNNRNQSSHHGGGGRGGNPNEQQDHNDDRRSHQPYNYRSSRGRGRHHHHQRRSYEHEKDESNSRRLHQFINAIPKYKPVPLVKKRDKPRHVAILFLTIADLPFEHVWRRWLSTVEENKKEGGMVVSILCHAKFPDRVTSPWLKRHLLVCKPSLQSQRNQQRRDQHNHHHGHTSSYYSNSNSNQYVRYHTRTPEWGSVEITQAMIDLLEEALRIGTKRDHYAKEERYSTKRFVVPTGTKDAGDNAGSTPGTNNKNNSSSASSSSGVNTAMMNINPPTVDRFIFASETCMPVSTLSELELALFGPPESINTTTPSIPRPLQNNNHNQNKKTSSSIYHSNDAEKSWLQCRNTPNNGHARQKQWDATHSSIPRDRIWKADQWIVLTRHHTWPIVSLIEEAASEVVKKERERERELGMSSNGGGRGGGRYNNRRGGGRFRDRNDRNSSSSPPLLALWQCLRDVKASDEIYFPTAMALLGILDSNDEKGDDENSSSIVVVDGNATNGKDQSEDHESEIARRRATYCDWSMNAKNPASIRVARHERNFEEFRKVVQLAREEGCLFARKFQECFSSSTSHIGGSSGDGGKEKEEEEERRCEKPIECITGDEWLDIITKK